MATEKVDLTKTREAQLGESELSTLQSNGPRVLPDNPSASGWSGAAVKKQLYKQAEILFTWLKRLAASQLDLGDKLNAYLDAFKISKNTVKVYESMIAAQAALESAEIEEGSLVFVFADDDITAYSTTNNGFVKIGDSFAEVASQIDGLQGLFSSGKANKAIADEDGNNIKGTYETKTDAAAKLAGIQDGTYTAKKAEKDADGNTISSTYGKLGSTNSWIGTNVFKIINLSYDGDGGTVTSFRKDLPVIATGGSYGAGNITKYYLPYDQSNLPAGYTVFTLSTSYDVANAKAEALASAASTAQAKVDALASALGFSNGAFGTIVAALLKVTKMDVTNIETKTATLEDQFLEMLAGNTVAYGTNYVGFVFAKYDGSNDFFVGIYNDTLMLGDCIATRVGGKITSIAPIITTVDGVSHSSLEPLATRAATSALIDGHLVKWDGTNLRLIDAGVSDTDISTVLLQESSRVSAESARVLAEQGRVAAETQRALQEKYRAINHPYAITQAEYNTLMNGGVFGVHLSTPLVEGDDPELIYTVYASEALAEAANETYIFPIQDNIEYPAKDAAGDIPPAPSVDGTYVRKCTVTNGVAVYYWEEVE